MFPLNPRKQMWVMASWKQDNTQTHGTRYYRSTRATRRQPRPLPPSASTIRTCSGPTATRPAARSPASSPRAGSCLPAAGRLPHWKRLRRRQRPREGARAPGRVGATARRRVGARWPGHEGATARRRAGGWAGGREGPRWRRRWGAGARGARGRAGMRARRRGSARGARARAARARERVGARTHGCGAASGCGGGERRRG
jgi:hypothetical protein